MSEKKRALPGLARGLPIAMAIGLLAGASCMSGDLQVAVPKATARILAVGPIENRDARYSPFTTQNFIDMLDFELVRVGYDTLRARDLEADALTETSPENKTTNKNEQKNPGSDDSEQSETKRESPQIQETDPRSSPDSTPAGETETSPAVKTEAVEPAEALEPASDPAPEATPEVKSETSDPAPTEGDARAGEEAAVPGGGGRKSGEEAEFPLLAQRGAETDSVSDLLPDYLQNVAGQKPPPEATPRSGTKRRRLYSKQEIVEFFKENEVDFFLQGSIGRTESGDLLDSEQNTLIFLEIYGRTGERIGVVSFLINGETLETPDILREVCADVVAALSGQVLK
jgi:hypothetical protein